jgi:hypothetical protein
MKTLRSTTQSVPQAIEQFIARKWFEEHRDGTQRRVQLQFGLRIHRTGHDDDPLPRLCLEQLFCKVAAGFGSQVHIHQNQVEMIFQQRAHGFRRIVSNAYPIAVLLQHHGQRKANGLGIIHYKNGWLGANGHCCTPG